MFGSANDVPGLIIVLAGLFFFILAVLMPLFVMLIYFELKNINRFIRKNIANPIEEEKIRELQQKLAKRR